MRKRWRNYNEGPHDPGLVILIVVGSISSMISLFLGFFKDTI